MKTFVVPTDFSEIAKNAAIYAAQFASDTPGIEIILYHAYPEIYAGSDGSPLNDEGNAREKIFSTALESIKADMLAVSSNLTISWVLEENAGFVSAIEKFLVKQEADLAFMGITGTSKVEEILFGSTTLDIIRRNICPVVVVPPEARFEEINNVLLATDLEDMETGKPLESIRQVLGHFHPKLHIVHVHEDPASMQQEQDKAKAMYNTELSEFNPRFYFIKDSNIVDTIDQFAHDNNIDLIVTVPRKHALGGLFQTSHTKRLAYHTHVPLVAIHE